MEANKSIKTTKLVKNKRMAEKNQINRVKIYICELENSVKWKLENGNWKLENGKF